MAPRRTVARTARGLPEAWQRWEASHGGDDLASDPTFEEGYPWTWPLLPDLLCYGDADARKPEPPASKRAAPKHRQKVVERRVVTEVVRGWSEVVKSSSSSATFSSCYSSTDTAPGFLTPRSAAASDLEPGPEGQLPGYQLLGAAQKDQPWLHARRGQAGDFEPPPTVNALALELPRARVEALKLPAGPARTWKSVLVNA